MPSTLRLLLVKRLARITKHLAYREHKVGRDLRARRASSSRHITDVARFTLFHEAAH